jgi:hypothetical protein
MTVFLKVELAKDMVFPYESPQESDQYWRIFRVPAALLNRLLGFGGASRPVAGDG